MQDATRLGQQHTHHSLKMLLVTGFFMLRALHMAFILDYNQ